MMTRRSVRAVIQITLTATGAFIGAQVAPIQTTLSGLALGVVLGYCAARVVTGDHSHKTWH